MLPFQSSIRENYGGYDTPVRITSRVFTLDSYADKIGASAIDIIKIDAETSEPRILKEAQNVLRKYEPWVICEVLFNDTDDMFPGLLDENVYE